MSTPRFFRTFVLAAITALATVGLAACDTGDGGTTQTDVQHVLITANDVNQLKDGERLKVDLRSDGTVYHVNFDSSGTPLDFARIEMQLASGDNLLLSDALKTLNDKQYSDGFDGDVVAAAEGTFGLAANPADFGSLSDADLATLEKDGYFKSSTDGAKPQNVDGCEIVTCYICLNGVCVAFDHEYCP
jgi:hypothetical protein